MTKNDLKQIILDYIDEHEIDDKELRISIMMYALDKTTTKPKVIQNTDFDAFAAKLPERSVCSEREFFFDHWENWDFFKDNCPIVWKQWNQQENRMRVTLDSLYQAFTLMTKTRMDFKTFVKEVRRNAVTIEFHTINGQQQRCAQILWMVRPKKRELSMLKNLVKSTIDDESKELMQEVINDRVNL